jgi:hypothetical protein
MEVYKAISAILGEMAHQGIAKGSKNKSQGWQFRGIDAVYSALAPLLAKYELLILPRISNRTVCEKLTKNGGTVFYVTVDAEFDFVSAKDGSKHTVKTIGEAMDSGDKATNKAMSIALKYAAFQAFFIPTEATMSDADKETYEIQQTDANVKSWVEAIKSGKTTIDDPNLQSKYKDQVRNLL